MLHIGCHLSSSKGFAAMGKTAQSIGADTFAFFTRNPRGSKAKPIDPKDVEAFKTLWTSPVPLVAHAPYTLNACSTKEEVRTFARETIADDLHKMEAVPGNYYNMHPGNHLQQGAETGIAFIADCLNQVMWEEQSTILLLETMAGKGTEVGRTFEEIAELLSRLKVQEKVGVCLDTCHIWDGGYDIVHDLDGVLTKFDQVIGLKRLKAVHLNDSKNVLGAHKDRHEKIGEGQIGFAALSRVTNHPALRNLPFILETPNELSGYAAEIKRLRDAFEE
ncbi:MAG: deoxyribonuclease IV [Acidaminococcus sp.]|jgi:deoxyribonuclease-4|nr:deoxyribonuclease IV [Acidaminococcus sp.]MCI2099790.1 deoxyribonuclease IV [Acidaminococcus sp.]MCI2114018.1 deoxyribonuclease IV [Acidaminococcus sp.]MCI2115888.1 deoxyribonuclease IV [Acidaminococcus sp.]